MALFCRFTPPYLLTVAGGLELHILSASLDDQGQAGPVALEVWNGTLLHEATLHLRQRKARLDFIADVRAVDAAADEAALRIGLSTLSHELPDAIHRQVAATPSPTTPAPAADPSALLADAGPLLADPALLERAAETLAALGLAGEQTVAKLLYLLLTSRLLMQPVSAIVKGPSSAGKSFLLKLVLLLFPPSAYVDYTVVSPRYLAFGDDELRHRAVVLFEARGITGETGAYIMRSLLSEGRLRLGTVDASGPGNTLAARQIEKEGPTSLLTTTTRASIDPETETRAFALGITDTPSQSEAILAATAAAYDEHRPPPPELVPWHTLQTWLEVAGARRVVIPYARTLASLVDCRTIRIRRDFGKLLSLIAACAILHQQQRARTSSGAVEASLEDYALVRELVAETFSSAQQEGLTRAQREAVEAVGVLTSGGPLAALGVSAAAVGQHLGIDRSAAYRRLANPLRAGYVRNLETRPRLPAQYVPGDPLPPAQSALPTRDELVLRYAP